MKPFDRLEVRPYQLMCIVCKIGEARPDDTGDSRLTRILEEVRGNPDIPVTLRCNVDSVYRYQNPGRGEDTPEGELFNDKRDLDILQRLGLVPGSTRPARQLFLRLLQSVPTARGICAYRPPTAREWGGCRRAWSDNYERGHALGMHAILLPRTSQQKTQAKAESARAVYESRCLNIRPHHLMCMACFYGDGNGLAPIAEDNLYEAIDVVRKNPDIPITLVAGCCMICPPCSHHDPASNLCVGANAMGLRDQKKDLDVLQRLGLRFGDSLPARELYARLFRAIGSTREVCGYGDGIVRAWEWTICGGSEGNQRYARARATGMGFLPKER